MMVQFLQTIRKSTPFLLLHEVHYVIMPARVRRKISVLQENFNKSFTSFQGQWTSLVDLDSFELSSEEIKGEVGFHLWGKICQGRFGGCFMCKQMHIGLWSSNVKVCTDEDKKTLQKIFLDVDSSLLPSMSDDKFTLTERISRSKYLDDIVIYNPSFSILNQSSTSHQPKRRSEGVIKKQIHVYQGNDGEGQGKKVITLPNYTSYGRHQDNWHGRPMKYSTFLAGLLCWRACWPYLTETSRKSPPTHCQILFYYGLLKSKIGYHRDNSNIEFIKNVVKGNNPSLDGHPSGGGENSQMVGSNVLILTIGNKPMNFVFKFPTLGNLTGGKKTYKTSPKHQFTCENMTISVLDPVDDIIMIHGASFSYNTRECQTCWYRIGYCFRWLQSYKDFYVDTCTMRLDSLSVHRKRCGKTANRNIFT